ncbi:MAG: tRNA 2-thiouridine(34) synthase MnmA [Ruminococcus sp.]|nr:tRNA 2-thiouridine(34) synthase MnmA [Ruminococcus sp.]
MKKVMIGMSGGVDSSAAALLLKEQGYEVIGVTLEMFSDDDIAVCTNAKNNGNLSGAGDAERVAEKLGFQYITVDMKECFRKYVMEYFCNSYLNGRTPNPCIECNRCVKFGEMLKIAQKNGCDYIATGHYAVCEYDEKRGRYLLKRSADRSKDQTYMLYSLTQEQLAHIIFPLGNMEKSAVREIAAENGLINADKPDSQDICFVPDGKYVEFIEKFTGEKAQSGNYVDMSGKILGKHKGHINYTPGQRKGLGIALGKPAYVVKKDCKTNTVVLGDESDLYTMSLIAENVNLISVEKITEPMRITAKARYSQKDCAATLSKTEDGRYLVEFDEPQRAVTSGQAVVFYDGDIVVGGGTII